MGRRSFEGDDVAESFRRQYPLVRDQAAGIDSAKMPPRSSLAQLLQPIDHAGGR
jgi:hypothetical protein